MPFDIGLNKFSQRMYPLNLVAFKLQTFEREIVSDVSNLSITKGLFKFRVLLEVESAYQRPIWLRIIKPK